MICYEYMVQCSSLAMGEVTEDTVPGLALLGAGQFACTTYVPKLGDLAHLASLKIIWSRSKVCMITSKIFLCFYHCKELRVGGSQNGSIIPGQEGLQFEDFQSLLLSRLSANKNSGLDTEETKTGPCLTSMENEWQDAALKGLELAKPYAPEAEAKWGDEGLEAIWNDKTIHAVAVVLPAQAQV